jgi:hypothetical protein
MHPYRSAMARTLIALAAVYLASPPARADEATSAVTLYGKPLAQGRILFHLDQDQFVGAKIKKGNYAIAMVPVGTRRITVEGV